MEKLLITGGCGFIGLNLIHSLLIRLKDVRIKIVDNYSVGTPDDLSGICEYKELGANRIHEWNNKVSLVQGDIKEAMLMKAVCSGADGVVHLAANTGVIPSIDSPRMDCENNVLGTFNVLDACKANHVSRFVFASSGAPLGEQIPPIHEEMVPKPISPYGASKLCGEAYCSAYHASFGVETVVLRFGNVYGPYSFRKGSVVAKFIREIINGETLTIYGDGHQTRDFIYIEDLCRAIWNGLTIKGVGGEAFQIATHKEHTINEVAKITAALIKERRDQRAKIEYADERRGEVRRNYSDISKARERLNWEPRWSFEEGIRETVKWFCNNM